MYIRRRNHETILLSTFYWLQNIDFINLFRRLLCTVQLEEIKVNDFFHEQ